MEKSKKIPVMNIEKKEALLRRPEIIVEKYGYEYVLVESSRGGLYSSSPFGKTGYVIRAIRKIKKQK